MTTHPSSCSVHTPRAILDPPLAPHVQSVSKSLQSFFKTHYPDKIISHHLHETCPPLWYKYHDLWPELLQLSPSKYPYFHHCLFTVFSKYYNQSVFFLSVHQISSSEALQVIVSESPHPYNGLEVTGLVALHDLSDAQPCWPRHTDIFSIRAAQSTTFLAQIAFFPYPHIAPSFILKSLLKCHVFSEALSGHPEMLIQCLFTLNYGSSLQRLHSSMPNNSLIYYTYFLAPQLECKILKG